MDPFTIKPLDKAAVLRHAEECGGNVITVEDHYPEGKTNFLNHYNFLDYFVHFLKTSHMILALF